VLTDDVAAAALDALPSFVAILAADGTVVRLNEAWRRSAATGLAVVPARPGGSWFAACESAAERLGAAHRLASLTRQVLDHRRSRARLEIGLATPRGHRWLDVRLRPVAATGGLIVVVDDVTDRHDREDALRRRATHDPVTGLLNRLTIRDLIGEALTSTPDADRAASTSPGGSPTTLGGGAATPGTGAASLGKHLAAVVFLDLDGFRRVNQTFGYGVGDGVLREVGVRFGAVLPPDSRLGRWGGDEFVVLARDVTGAEAASLAEGLTGSLAEQVTVDRHRVRITASVGLALSGMLPDVTAPTRTSAAADADVLVRLAGEELVRARAHHHRRPRPRP
jgi:diguanylate cyclase (GGDEF)-like protein